MQVQMEISVIDALALNKFLLCECSLGGGCTTLENSLTISVFVQFTCSPWCEDVNVASYFDVIKRSLYPDRVENVYASQFFFRLTCWCHCDAVMVENGTHPEQLSINADLCHYATGSSTAISMLSGGIIVI